MIVGASGFVGLALAEHLPARGDAVIAADIEPMPPRAAHEFPSLPGRLVAAERLDATDAGTYAALVARHRPRAAAATLPGCFLVVTSPGAVFGRWERATDERLVDTTKPAAQPLHLAPGITWRLAPDDPSGESACNARAQKETEALAALTGFRAAQDLERATKDDLAWRRAAAD